MQICLTIRTIHIREDVIFVASNERIVSVQKWIDSKFEIADKIEDNSLKVISYFTITDSLAQNVNGYKWKGASDAFCKFVCMYQNTYDFLGDIDPVTLYYDLENKLFQDIDVVDYLDDGNVYYPENILSNMNLKRIIARAKDNGNNKIIAKHSYIRLLYQLRNKLVHEFSVIGGPMDWTEDSLPFYNSVDRLFGENEMKSNPKKRIWQLTFPTKFIRELLYNAIDNYFIECIKEQKDPYNNNNILRPMYLAWYD